MSEVIDLDQFIKYITETLHVEANTSHYDNSGNLPLYLRNAYVFSELTIQSVRCLLAHPKEVVNLSVLRKQSMQLKVLTNMDIVLCLDNIRIYTREAMLAEGIPFVVTGQQIYMPFLGIALSKSAVRELQYKEKISFITQKMILTAIYNDWKSKTLTEVAISLGISKMSVSRCFDEVVSLGLDIVKSDGKFRRFNWEGDRQSLWDAVYPYLRNPVIRKYNLCEHIDLSLVKLGGMSAVCHYSMLSDNEYKTYAVTRGVEKYLEFSKEIRVPDNEQPHIIMQILGYDYEHNDCNVVDPLTAVLSLTDEEKEDPRIGLAVEQILEDFLHG